ncbi:hypothetical protein [Haladaptatus sp. CMAA 1911]|uniref:hypothetical protein n=1 Tax=unclassified Haladaptatus TaxID=2622732 RepID=UPI003754CDB1
MTDIIERLRDDEERESEQDAAEETFRLLNQVERLSKSKRDVSGIIERHAGEIHEIYQDVDTDDVSNREMALLYAYGQLCLWGMDNVGTPQQRHEDLIRRIDAVERGKRQ